MRDIVMRSLLVAAIVICDCISWTASRHHYGHNASGHRSRHRRQGARLFLPGSYVIPGGEGHGAWGPWGEATSCSRSCGGGVAYQERICLEIAQDGRSRCQGGERKYFSCNTQDCPDTSMDYRSEQCAAFDSVPIKNITYNWVPYTKAPNPCELNCMPRGERFYYRHREKVVDGTPCNSESLDVCVDGTCQPVGCDMMLGSQAKEDKCRECRGNGTSCKTFTEINNDQDLRSGYNDILLIPAGSTNIDIAEVRPSNNYLAIRSAQDRKYYLNGDFRIDFPRHLQFAGSVWIYERSPQGFAAPDMLRCQGPTTEPVYLSLLLLDVNVGVRYEYSVPTSMVPLPDQQYGWVYDAFSPCSATCGGGFQSRTVTCRSRQELQEVDESLCDAQLRPPSNQTCAGVACAPRWVEGPWGPCSQPCGEGGSQSREVHCEKVIAHGQASMVADDECFSALGPKADLHRRCNEGGNCPSWHTGPWNPCDKLCGDGKKTRQVTCFLRTDGRVERLPDADCSEEKPPAEEACILHPCEGVDWITSDWSACDPCLPKSVRTRTSYCSTKDGEVVNSTFCEHHKPPALQEDCDTADLSGCQYQWFASQWSKCTPQCGAGEQRRQVFCAKMVGTDLTKVKDELCDPDERYKESRACANKEEDCPAAWHAGPWSECSEKCGGEGEQVRRYQCIHGGKVSTGCNVSTIPDSSQPCNRDECDADHTLPDKPGGTQPSFTDDYEDCPEEEAEDEEYPEEGLESIDGTTPASTDGGSTSDDLMSTLTDEGFMSDSPSTSDTEGSGFDFASTYFTSDITDITGSGDGELGTAFTSPESTDLTLETKETDITGSESSGATTDGASTESSASSTDISSSDKIESTSESISSLSEITTQSENVTGSESTNQSEVTSESTKKLLATTEEDDDEDSDSGSDTAVGDTDIYEEPSIEKSPESSSTAGEESSSADTTEVTTESETYETSDESTETTNDLTSESTSDVSSTVTTIEASESSTETQKEETEGTSTESPNTSTDVSGSTEEASTGTSEASTEAKETESSTESGGTTESSGTSESKETSESDSTTDAGSTTQQSSTLGSDLTSQSEASTESGSTTELESTSVSDKSSQSETSTESGSTTELENTSVSDKSSKSETSTESGSTTELESTSVSDKSSESESSTEPGSTTELESTSVSDKSSETETSTEYGSTTESGDTSESEASSVSESSTETVTTVEISSTEGSSTESGSSTEGITSWTTENEESSSWIWSTSGESTKRPRCRPRSRKSNCVDSTFGCCPDGKTAAAGPFEEGCPHPETCAETEYNCCPDGVSAAGGPKGAGCPSSHCNETLFGCCEADGETPAQGNDQEGCPPPPPPCEKSKYGCCKDKKSEAKGPKGKGCPENAPKPVQPKTCAETEHGCCYDNQTEASGPDGQGCPCAATQHGCCPDQVSPAQGPQMQGCVMSCNNSAYGCCPDNETPAHGRLGEGCCLATSFGCCPDNVNIAQGPHFEGCGCQFSPYGCCPDNVTVARGYNNEGCGCKHTPHGCCPNRYTPALGPNFAGCQCFTYQFGCCPDGKTVATGPQQLGCRCSDTEFGCCGDGQTPAQGPERAGCDCASSEYGCCPDGRTEARGEKFLNCTDKLESRQVSCGLEKERGPCNNYTVRWFYDTEYGGCSRFWYGGCEGNGNRFTSQQECQDVCVKPAGKDACLLPKTKGVCEGYHPRWYYDSEREVCGQFVYGGCLGNNNNFETREECQGLCEEPRSKDQCALPIEAGSCAGNFVRWAFDAESKRCSQFVWGGCEGNANRFASESACIQQCDAPGTLKDECRLPREAGNCTEKVPKWYFDQGENRCMPFYYGGCGGNDNQYDSERECESRCPQVVVQDTCTLPAVTGDCADYRARWYYDSALERCSQFYYGGCNGNGNNFPTQEECQRRCVDAPTTTPSPVTAEPFRSDFCFLQAERGPCGGSEARYHYDARTGSCRQFLYGGCGGNQNNFPTQEHCHSYCASVQDLCQLPMLVGPCDDSQMQWYYDARSDSCSQFAYSGCQGNPNRFNSREECEGRCKTTPVTTTTTMTPIPVPAIDQRVPEREECRQPASLEPCGREQEAWYYDDLRHSCTKTTSGACQRLNNYVSEEACERSCGVFRGLEACRYPVDPGVCRGSILKFYFDEESGHCFEFAYGGCGGSPNRFSSVEECRQVCGAREPEAVELPVDVCLQPLESGRCAPEHYSPSRRWHYSDELAACQVFIYEGCGGNQNNFRSYDECELYCSKEIENNTIPEPCDEYDAECERLRCEFGVERRKTPEGCERCVCLPDPCARVQCTGDDVCTVETVDNTPQAVCGPGNEVIQRCDTYRAECESISCDFGVERRRTQDDCEQCVCAHPCSTLTCGDGDRCTVDYTPENKPKPVCRPSNKPGTCPFFPEEPQAAGERCARECNDDADCAGGDKCCRRGCHAVCAPPTDAPRTRPPPPHEPRAEQPSAPFVDPASPSEVTSSEGGLATLRCIFSGYPAPTIVWQRGELTIDSSSGHYRILTDGALQIVSVYRNDSGVYVCIGDNGVGEPARKEVTLDVRDPVPGSAGIAGDENASVVGTLHQPLLLRCASYGYPAPDVFWWKGSVMLPFASQYYEIGRDGLLVRSLELETLGVYTCQAFNGLGKPASWSVTVRAHRTDEAASSPWLVEREGRVEEPPPTRPPPTPSPDYIDPNIVPGEYVPPVYNVPVTTSIPAERTTYPAGSELSLPCAVEGHPLPRVHWSKDGEPLQPSDRVHVSEANRLTIIGVQTNDSGVYTCHASNEYSSHSSYVQINVEGLYLHPNCTDNPFFANCQLIVKGQYCRHQYYASFCCRSCTLAGQLSPQDMLADQPRFRAWKRK